GARAWGGGASRRSPRRAHGGGRVAGPPGRDVVGQGAPEPLRRDMVGLLHYALAVAAPRRARPRGHPVVLGHRRERRGHPPRFWVHDGGHSVEPPGWGISVSRSREIHLNAVNASGTSPTVTHDPGC